jgi:hypothetical protein
MSWSVLTLLFTENIQIEEVTEASVDIPVSNVVPQIESAPPSSVTPVESAATPELGYTEG